MYVCMYVCIWYVGPTIYEPIQPYCLMACVALAVPWNKLGDNRLLQLGATGPPGPLTTRGREGRRRRPRAAAGPGLCMDAQSALTQDEQTRGVCVVFACIVCTRIYAASRVSPTSKAGSIHRKSHHRDLALADFLTCDYIDKPELWLKWGSPEER
jgi:hypothetical protein